LKNISGWIAGGWRIFLMVEAVCLFEALLLMSWTTCHKQEQHRIVVNTHYFVIPFTKHAVFCQPTYSNDSSSFTLYTVPVQLLPNIWRWSYQERLIWHIGHTHFRVEKSVLNFS
jgi:hypothetical protein